MTAVLSYAEQQVIGLLLFGCALVSAAWLWLTSRDRRDHTQDQPAPANPYMPTAGIGCCCASCNDARDLVEAGMHRVDAEYEQLCAKEQQR